MFQNYNGYLWQIDGVSYALLVWTFFVTLGVVALVRAVLVIFKMFLTGLWGFLAFCSSKSLLKGSAHMVPILAKIVKEEKIPLVQIKLESYSRKKLWEELAPKRIQILKIQMTHWSLVSAWKRKNPRIRLIWFPYGNKKFSMIWKPYT